MIDDLNDENFLIYAIKAYDKPFMVMSELEEDLKRFKYIKRLIRKYKATGELKERLILNHLIVLGNVFGVEAAVRMLYYRMDKEDYEILKTFLLYLNYQPRLITGINGKNLNSGDISVDLFVAKKLRDI
jgi:hypothetical protein